MTVVTPSAASTNAPTNASPSAPSPATPPLSGEGAGASGQAPPAARPAPIAAPPSAPTTPTAAPTSTPMERAPTRKLLTGDTDDLPDDAETYEIGKSAFKKRLERYSRSQLKQLFGTDNVDEISGWKTAAEAAAQREEEQRLAQMTESERYKTQWEREKQTSAHWKQQYEQLQDQLVIREQDQQVMGIVQRHVDPTCVKFVAMELAEYLAQADEIDPQTAEAHIDQWVRQYVHTNPKFGLTVGASAQPPNGAGGANGNGINGAPAQSGNVHNFTPPGGQQQPAPRQINVPFSNGAAIGRPNGQQAANPDASKTIAPGLHNSMTKDEVMRWKREHGYDF